MMLMFGTSSTLWLARRFQLQWGCDGGVMGVQLGCNGGVMGVQLRCNWGVMGV